ncbi:hypothetical protein Tco_1272521 [Tanacetum coccineum]
MLTEAIKQSKFYQMFIKYSTCQIPQKKSRGKGSQGKKTVDTHVTEVVESEESEPEPAKKRPISKKRVKKSATISAEDNIIPDPDIAFELGDDEHISKAQDIDDEDAEPELGTDEIYKYKIHSAEEVGDAKKVAGSSSQVKESNVFPIPSPRFSQSHLFWATQFLNSSCETSNLPPILETPVFSIVSSSQVTPIISHVQQSSTPIPTPPIIIDALTVTTIVLESDVLSTVQLRVENLEKDVSELKRLDISTEAFVALQIHVLIAVDNYLDSKITKKKTPTIDLEQETKNSYSEILKLKKEYVEKQQITQFTIKSTNKAALKEFGLKSALYQHMHENKSFNRNPANHRLYHALMEALIEDKNAMDKRVADTVEDHKRKHDDDDDDDDDEDPSAGPNQGKTKKRRRTKESMSSKKPSATKDTSKVKLHLKPPKPKDKTPKWFKQPPRPPTPDPEWNKCQAVLDQPAQPWFNQMVSDLKDPLTFDSLMATLIDFSKFVLNGLKIDNLTQDLLLGPAYNLLKGTCSSSIELEYNFQECFNDLTEKLNWNNPEGDRYPFDLSKPLSLQELHDRQTVVADYFFNNDLEYDKDAARGIKHWGERRNLMETDLRIIEFARRNATNSEDSCVNSVKVKSYQKKLNITAPQRTSNEIDCKEIYTPSHKPPGAVYEDQNQQKRVMRADTYKSRRGTHQKFKISFIIEYNDLTVIPIQRCQKERGHKWAEIGRAHNKQFRERRIIRNLEKLVGARELEMDYKMMTRAI